METNQVLPVEIVPFGKDQWKSMGTEYEKSFTAFKEILDNSVSASMNHRCEILITLEEQFDDNLKISVEDSSGGVQDANTLLRISSDSQEKEGTHNIYGHGLKHALAFFNSDYNTSNWLIQSRTHELLSEEKILQVRAPYLYNHEYNDEFLHYGMNVMFVDDKEFKGEKSKPGTFIQFTTPRNVFAKMNPMKGSGAPTTLLKTIAEDLCDLISLYYLPLLKKGLLDVEVRYRESDGKSKFKSIRVESDNFPSLHTISYKEYNNYKVPTVKGGYMKVSAKWIQINRSATHRFVYPQKNGLICYVNGILVDPFVYIEQVFGGIVQHPSLNSLICVVEVESSKLNTPELSVSKTKFRINGENYISLIQHLSNICPKSDIIEFQRKGNSESELELRDKRFDMLLCFHKNIGLSGFVKKEEPCLLPNHSKAGDNLRYDIIYQLNNNNIVIEEFKKEIIKPDAVAQIVQYGELAKKQYSSDSIELVLVSKKISPTAESLLSMYSSNGWNIKFKSFAELYISG